MQVLNREILNDPSSVSEWFSGSAFISNYYNSGATSDMIGVTGDEFRENTMNWNSSKLAILFMSAYERPSYDPNVNHYILREQYAENWYNYIQNIPPTPPTPTTRKKFNWVIFTNKIRKRRLDNFNNLL